jgi:hypothetical protein
VAQARRRSSCSPRPGFSRVVTLLAVQLKAEVVFDGVTARRLVGICTKYFVLLSRKKHLVFNGGRYPTFSVPY